MSAAYNQSTPPTASAPEKQTVPNSQAQIIKATLPREACGPPGIPSHLHVVPADRPTTQEEDKARLSDATDREFRIVAVLGRSAAIAETDLRIDFDTSQGESLLRIPAGEQLSISTPGGAVKLYSNAANEVSGLGWSCRATSPDDALRRWSENVTPMLDHMAYALDRPIYVKKIGWLDVSNGIIGAEFVPPYDHADARGLGGAPDPKLRSLYALYREAVNNPSVLYQFLCYVKVLEGALHWYLPRIRKDAKERGIPLTSVTLKVPQLDPISADSKASEYAGRTVSDALNKYLWPEFRNSLAHFTDDTREPLDVSSVSVVSRHAGALELARVCARLGIQTIEEYLRQVLAAENATPI